MQRKKMQPMEVQREDIFETVGEKSRMRMKTSRIRWARVSNEEKARVQGWHTGLPPQVYKTKISKEEYQKTNCDEEEMCKI